VHGLIGGALPLVSTRGRVALGAGGAYGESDG